MLKKYTLRSLALIFIFSICISCSNVKQSSNISNDDEYIVAAYVWPSCHDEPMAREYLWGEGIGEWEIIKKCKPRFEGHYQPRIPLWGYQMDDDPKAWEQKIEAAISHGVNTFIFDWYWYDEKPFLEEAVNLGFLGAANNEKANFYLMWANHDAWANEWSPYHHGDDDSILWNADVDWENYKIIVDRVINQYFKRSNYLKIDGCPIFSVYHPYMLLKSFNGDVEETRKGIDYFRAEVKKAGFPDLHLQFIGKELQGGKLYLGKSDISIPELVEKLGINSVSMYCMTGMDARNQDYLIFGGRGIEVRNVWDSILDIPFFPNVAVGWDNTPRHLDYGKEDLIVHFNNTPESFGAYLQKAKEYADNHPEQPRIITIYAWNEWVEGSYLEPDMLNGYGYLEAVKKVIIGEYEK